MIKEKQNTNYFCTQDFVFRTCILNLNFQSEIKYVPGDHIGVMAGNQKEIVDAVLDRLKGIEELDTIVQLQVMKETLTPTGNINNNNNLNVNVDKTGIIKLFTKDADSKGMLIFMQTNWF